MYIPSGFTMTSLASEVPLTVREAISGALGSISMACWIFLLAPQVIENYRNQSAEAISFLFICIWAIGDVANLLGSLWASLIPTTVAIAIWFCFQDTVMVTQCLYYGIRNRRQQGKSWLAAARESVSGTPPGDDAEAIARVRQEQLQRRRLQDEEDDAEEQPLLKRTVSIPTGRRERITLPDEISGLTEDQLMRRRRTSTSSLPFIKNLEDEQEQVSTPRQALKKILALFGVFVVGTLGWYASYRMGVWHPVPLHDEGGSPRAQGAQILGYISAIAYLGARIPQILKNWREQSCDGLSLLFFILSLSGNLTQGASILFHSTERAYVIKNVPWLLGSLGTMAEDITIFTQFHMYGSKSRENAVQ